MDRKQFLAALMMYLPAGINDIEKSEFLDYYDEMIREFVADGYTEEEATAMVGDPEEIVANGEFSKAYMKDNAASKGRINLGILLLLVLGFPLWGSILLAVVCLLLSGYILLWTPLIVTGSFTVAGLLGGLASMLLSLVAVQDGLAVALMQFGSGMVLVGIGLICGVLTVKCSGWILAVSKRKTMAIWNGLQKGVTRYGY